jgi:hypothetical protein
MRQQSDYLTWRKENVDRLSQITDWRELCIELLDAADKMTVENDGNDAHYDLVADRVRQLATELEGVNG